MFKDMSDEVTDAFNDVLTYTNARQKRFIDIRLPERFEQNTLTVSPRKGTDKRGSTLIPSLYDRNLYKIMSQDCKKLLK